MEKPAKRYLATNASFPGYWGAHADSPHHAIVECINAGADRGSVFVVHDAYEGCYFNDFGALVFLTDHGKPEVEGVYDATGQWLGENLAAVVKDCQTNDWWVAEHPLLSKETIAALKKHKPE